MFIRLCGLLHDNRNGYSGKENGNMKDFRPLDEQERAAIDRAREIFNSYPKVPCTACGYCMKGCPKHIAIYGIFQAVNVYQMWDDSRLYRR